jgi:hypothetical protein
MAGFPREDGRGHVRCWPITSFRCNTKLDRYRLISDMVRVIGWAYVLDQRFFDPIKLPDRKPLVTLRDAVELISALPEVERALPQWVTAIECLLLVAEHNAPTMFARIAMMQALHSDRQTEATIAIGIYRR